MIKNPFRKKGENELNKNPDNHEAEIVDLAEEQDLQQSSDQNPDASQTTQATSPEVEWKNKVVRLQADFDNYRKRTMSGRTEAREEIRREIMLDLLPVYDNFQRALTHADDQEDFSSLRTGLEGIMQQMREVFNRHNLKEIPATTGTPFNPNLHEAVGTMPGDESDHDTVAQEVLKGYELNGYVIRPAQVLVYA